MKLAMMKLGRLALASLLATGLASGCKKDGGDQSDDGEAGAPTSSGSEEGAGGLSYDPASEKSYKVRGLVQSDIRDGVVMIHHEKIPDFANRQNEVKGMMSMAMGFGIEDGVDAGVLAKGAKVALEFDVRWKQNPPLRITSATALDPATELDFAGSLPTKRRAVTNTAAVRAAAVEPAATVAAAKAVMSTAAVKAAAVEPAATAATAKAVTTTAAAKAAATAATDRRDPGRCWSGGHGRDGQDGSDRRR